MGEEDGDVHNDRRVSTGRAEESDAVEDVKGKPADRKQEEDEGQRLGQFELLAKVTARVCVARGHLQIKTQDHQHIV